MVRFFDKGKNSKLFGFAALKCLYPIYFADIFTQLENRFVNLKQIFLPDIPPAKMGLSEVEHCNSRSVTISESCVKPCISKNGRRSFYRGERKMGGMQHRKSPRLFIG